MVLWTVLSGTQHLLPNCLLILISNTFYDSWCINYYFLISYVPRNKIQIRSKYLQQIKHCNVLRFSSSSMKKSVNRICEREIPICKLSLCTKDCLKLIIFGVACVRQGDQTSEEGCGGGTSSMRETFCRKTWWGKIWVNCYCWGNSSMVEDRLSKWS